MRGLRGVGVWFLLLAVSCVFGCVAGCRAARDGAVTGVALYGWGLGTGVTEVDFAARRLHAVGPDLVSGRDCGVLDVEISAKERDELAALVERCELRGFREYPAWFEGEGSDAGTRVRMADWRSVLSVSFGDEERLFDLHSGGSLAGVPRDARRRYEGLNEVSSFLTRLVERYSSEARVTRVAPGDERVEELHRRLEDVSGRMAGEIR